jgi:hypothetical protein
MSTLKKGDGTALADGSKRPMARKEDQGPDARDFACCRRARVESAETSLPENVSCTLYRMTGQAELFEIWFSGFNGRCTEGM